MANPKVKPHQKKSLISEIIEKKFSKLELQDEGYFMVSFRHLDRKQGDNLYDWEGRSILAHSLEVIAGYCNGKLHDQKDGEKFTIYGDFPPKNKTNYTFPNHVPEDADWARIHINGKQCVIGHVVKNIFYVVFLDGDHSFWKSEK